jgi:hypothetical protein
MLCCARQGPLRGMHRRKDGTFAGREGYSPRDPLRQAYGRVVTPPLPVDALPDLPQPAAGSMSSAVETRRIPLAYRWGRQVRQP